MYFQLLKTKECFVLGALNGAAAWLIYGIAENLFTSVFPWLIKPAYIYQPWHWGFSLLLMLFIYPVIGMITAGLFALALRLTACKTAFLHEADQNMILPVIATVTIILVFSLNLVYISITGNSLSLLDRPVMLTLSLSFIMIIMLLITARPGTGYHNLRLIINPWTASFILTGVMWVNQELFNSYSLPAKITLNVIYVVLVFSFSYVIHKTIKGSPMGTSNLPDVPSRMKFSALGLTVIVLIGLSFAFKQTPLITPRHQSQGNATPSSPNVILVVMDTVRADHLSLYGYERDTSPNLNKFTENAFLYTEAVAPGNMTLTSHASIFTGYSARQHGAHDPFPSKGPGQPLDEEFKTLAETLSEEGYSTMAVVSNISFLSPAFGLHQGFEHYDNRSRIRFLSGKYPYSLRHGIRNFLAYFLPYSSSELVCRRAEKINLSVFDLLKQNKEKNMPFFMFINYMDAHRPLLPPPPYDSMYPGKNSEYIPSRYFFSMKKEVMTFKRDLTEKEHSHMMSQYDGEISYLDFHIGKLIEKLKILDLYENSIIIITSDHGDMFGWKNMIGHGVSVYQGELHVPLIIKYPHSNEGRVIDKPVNIADIMPLVLNRLGYAKPERTGEIKPGATDSEPAGYIVSESYPSKYFTALHERFRNIERALYSGKYKFISSTAGKKEIYDLSKDPGETINLYKTDNDITETMEVYMDRWLSSVPEFSGKSRKIDKDTKNRLKSLGYIQ